MLSALDPNWTGPHHWSQLRLVHTGVEVDGECCRQLRRQWVQAIRLADTASICSRWCIFLLRL